MRGASTRVMFSLIGILTTRRIIKSDPASLAGAASASFRKRHIADAGHEIRGHWHIRHEMAQEILPANPIGIEIRTRGWRFLPARAVIDSEVDHRIERGHSGRIREWLHVATVQPRNGGAFGAV